VAGSVATVADEAPLLLTSPPSPPRLSTTASRHGRRSLVRGHCCCFFRSLPSRYISTAPPAPHLHLWRPRSIVSFPSLEVVSTRVVFTDSLAPSPRLPLSLASSDAAGSPLLHHGRKWPRWSIAAIAAGVGITYASNPDATSHCWPCCRLPLVRPGPVCPFSKVLNSGLSPLAAASPKG
jgi:hypothetical protein